MTSTKKMKCNCRSEYQDNKYGTGIRIFNKMADKKGFGEQYRCTVCGTVRSS